MIEIVETMRLGSELCRIRKVQPGADLTLQPLSLIISSLAISLSLLTVLDILLNRLRNINNITIFLNKFVIKVIKV